MTSTPDPLQVAAVVAVACTVALIVIMDWVPTPLNRNIAGASVRSRLPGTVIHLVVGVGVIVVDLVLPRWGAVIGGVWFSAVLAVAVVNWWLPYLAGVTVGEIDLATYRREYAANPRVLPRIADHEIVPDIQHMLIHAALLVTVIMQWLAVAAA